MPTSSLADRAAALLSLTAATEERSLSQLTELAAREVPGCTAAAVTVWRDSEPANQASSHPEATRLADIQFSSGRGPLLEAAVNGAPVSCPDTLSEQRWPEFAATALAIGVRSCVVLSSGGTPVVTLSLFGTRPRAIDPSEQLAELLVAYCAALVGAVAEYDSSRRLADQLRDAASSRTIVDQAKGILMHALGCSADEALERMVQVSQRTNVRAVEVARRVVAAHSGPAGRVTSRNQSPGD
ncbi:MAG: GAF and ANTAR domain-containing protein [Actinobacteria bacterium]|nr:GAF and ANTAR domain-containing protein [Actinomycetota bacterium]MBO0838913.1 GAF and ANTAR domain-containing protein [Actinomycetota bacterium]